MFNVTVEDTVFHSAKPVIHLYGNKDLHQKIISLCQESAKTQKHKKVNYFGFDFEEILEIPRRPQTDKEQGIFRYQWFKKIARLCPSVQVAIFDYQGYSIEALMDWRQKELAIGTEIRKLRERNPKSKIVLLLLFRQTDIQQLGLEEKKISLKKMYDIDSQNIFLVSNHLDGLILINKKFEKILIENSINYYKEQKNAIKRKKKAMQRDNKESVLAIKYEFKLGYYTEIIRDSNKALRLYKDAYEFIKTLALQS